MDNHYTQPQLFLQTIQESNKMSATPDAMEFELLTIGYTCRLVQKIFGQDRTPEKDKLVMKILNLATNYFKESKSSVQQACCRVFVDLFRFCLIKEEISYQRLILYQPLEEMLLGGTERSAQLTAANCLQIFLQFLKKENHHELIKAIALSFTSLFIRPQIDQQDLIPSLILVSSEANCSNLAFHLQQILEKLLKFLTVIAPKQKNQKNQTQIYISVCQLIALVGQSGIDTKKVDQQTKDKVQEILFRLTTDSRVQVQQGSKEALNYWLKSLQQIESQKQPAAQIQDLRELRNQRKQQKLEQKIDPVIENDSLVKNSQLHNIDFLQNDQGGLKGFGSQVRGANYQKKRTGLGAGQGAMDQMDFDKYRPKVQPYQRRMQQLYDQIQGREESPQPKQAERFSPKIDDELADSLEQWNLEKKIAQDLEVQDKKKKQQILQQTPKKGASQQSVTGKQSLKKVSSIQAQDEFVFKSQLFEMSESQFSEGQEKVQEILMEKKKDLQESNLKSELQPIQEIKEENVEEMLPIKEEQYLKISKCFDQEYLESCAELEGKDSDLKLFASQQANRMIGLNSEVFKEFSKDEVISAVHLDVEKKKEKNSVFSFEQITKNQLDIGNKQKEGKRNFQNLIRNPPKQSLVKDSADFRNEQVAEQRYNLLNFKLKKENEKKKIEEVKIPLQERWQLVLQSLNDKKIDEAYQLILAGEDDIYLLRLMSITGPCIQKLSQSTAMQFSNRLKALITSEFWKVLGINIMSNICETNLTEQLKIDQKQKIQQLLYQWSRSWNPQISQQAASLYNNQYQ